jgi:uncharacterized protein YndB with AHSA1/START domain
MTAAIRPAPVRKSVTLRTTPAHAFQVFTAGIGDWWPATHHIGASPLKRTHIEPKAGGRWYSVCQDDSTCEVGKVLAWEPPGRLLLAWQIDGQFQYDANLITEVEVIFADQGDGTTRVDLEHRNLERMGDYAEPGRAMLDAPNGWGLILSLFAEAAQA